MGGSPWRRDRSQGNPQVPRCGRRKAGGEHLRAGTPRRGGCGESRARADRPASWVQMSRQHQEWIEDVVIRLLCVFALDRFGDFVSDEVGRHSTFINQMPILGSTSTKSFDTYFVPGGGSCQGDVCSDSGRGSSPHERIWRLHHGGCPAETAQRGPVGGPSRRPVGHQICPGCSTGTRKAHLACWAKRIN